MDLDDLITRAEIADALATYCRGIDRLDPDLVRAAFHPDGMLIDYGSPDPIAAADFGDYACERLRSAYLSTQHRVTNTKVERTGDTAVAESYVLAYHVEAGGDGEPGFLHTFNGRWIDTCERRGGPWLIARRILRVDWTRRDPWNEQMRGAYVASARDRTDPVYGATS